MFLQLPSAARLRPSGFYLDGRSFLPYQPQALHEFALKFQIPDTSSVPGINALQVTSITFAALFDLQCSIPGPCCIFTA